MTNMTAVDTNILLYILQGNAEFGEKARQLFSGLTTEELCISEQVFAEVLAHELFESNAPAFTLARKFLDEMDCTYIQTTKEIYIQAAEIRRRNNSVKLPDAVMLAAACASGAKIFVTQDKNLHKVNVGGLQIVGL
jgi:predicted nucleic acid-binding protein